MNRWLLLSLCGVALLFGPSVAVADSQGDAVRAALDADPPALPMTDARVKAIEGMDAFLGRPGSEHMPSVVDYYQAAVDRVLDKLERDRVVSGARLFQLYSSGVIVQTPETVFAFDVTLGGGRRSSASASEPPTWVHMSDAQVARLAKRVDYSFHTHAHGDHVNPRITEALLDAGKTVILTESGKAVFASQPWGQKITVLPQTVHSPVTLGPLKVDVLCDRQWGDREHTEGMPCNAYVVTTPGGVAVMTKGDINCGLQLYGWLALLKQRGQNVDVVVGSSIFWRGVDTTAEWNALFSPAWLPGHAWEFGHRRAGEPQGNCLAYAQSYWSLSKAAHSRKVQPLTWGEWIDVPGRVSP